MPRSVLTVVAQRVLAAPLVAFLADEGVEAWVESDDCGGVDPALMFSNGVRVEVRPEQLARAQELLTLWEQADILPPDFEG